jgi:hypothetical protein
VPPPAYPPIPLRGGRSGFHGITEKFIRFIRRITVSIVESRISSANANGADPGGSALADPRTGGVVRTQIPNNGRRFKSWMSCSAIATEELVTQNLLSFVR